LKAKKTGTAWRHANIGRLLNNAVRRFEARVLALMCERGHAETRIAHMAVATGSICGLIMRASSLL
jgi:hypothetical protein